MVLAYAITNTRLKWQPVLVSIFGKYAAFKAKSFWMKIKAKKLAFFDKKLKLIGL